MPSTIDPAARRLGRRRLDHVRLELAVRAAGLGVIELDAQSHEAVWMSERALQILGWTAPELPSAARYQGEIVHPDDRARHSQALVDAMRGGPALAQVVRIRRVADGQWRWIEAHGELVRATLQPGQAADSAGPAADSPGPVADSAGQAAGHPALFVVVLADVTDARRAQEQLDDQARRLAVALRAGRMGVWELDLVTGRHRWDAAQFELMRADPSRGAPDIEGFYACLHPDDAGEVRAMIDRAVRDRGHFRAEFRLREPHEGEPRWLATVGDACDAPYRLIGVNFDVTERKRVERLLAAEGERLAMALDAGRMGVWEIDLASGRRHWYPGMFALTGVDPCHGTPQDDDFYALIEPGDRAAARAAIGGLSRGQPRFAVQFRVRRRSDGSIRWIASQGQWMLDPAGGTPKAVGVCVDVTERVLTEQRLLEADARKNEFMATLAHELRNPLAPLRNVASLLRRTALTTQQVPLVEIMERQVGQLRRLVEDLLEVSRISQGKVVLRRERVGSVSAAVYTALEAAQPLIERRRQSLDVRLRSSAALLADPLRLSQVVTNLLTNASKFTPEGGAIELATTDEEGWVRIEVRDSGIGIAPELLPRIFDLFTQGAATAPDQAQSGLGIGLSLVRQLVELHAGTVSAASQGEGRGACFTVRLPRDP